MAGSRVTRWRERLREQGLKAVTVWLSVEEELRLKDLAAQWHTSPSAIVQYALAQFHPGRPPSLSNVSVPAQVQHSAVLDMAQIQAYLQAELPAMVRRLMEQWTVDTLVSETDDSDVTDDIQIRTSDVTDDIQRHSSDDTEITDPPQPKKRTGRQRSPMGQRILDLLHAHPEGLTAEQIRGHLSPERPIGDILSGMVRTGAVQMQGEGRRRRYVLPQQRD